MTVYLTTGDTVVCTTGTVYLTMTFEGVTVAANTKDTVVTGKLADHLVSWAKAEAELEGKLDGVHICDHRVTRVWQGHFRVSLYTKSLPEGNFIVPEYSIVASYLLECVDGKMIYNRTRRPNSALND